MYDMFYKINSKSELRDYGNNSRVQLPSLFQHKGGKKWNKKRTVDKIIVAVPVKNNSSMSTYIGVQKLIINE